MKILLKQLLVVFLQILGGLLIAAGLMVLIAVCFAPSVNSHKLGSLVMAIIYILFCGAPAAAGYFLIRMARKIELPRDDSESDKTKLIAALVLILMGVAAFYLPLQGRLIEGCMLVLIFTRIHRPWSSRAFRTPLGRICWADVFDFGVYGTFRVLIEVVFALLTRGSSIGFTFSGGSSGGGGSSGKW